MSESKIRIEHPLAPGAEVRSEDAWAFPAGLIGLPAYRSFVLLPLEQAPPFRLLAAADDPAFGIVLVDPTVLVPDYELTLETEDLALLGDVDPGQLQVLVPVVLPRTGVPLSLNLKGPLILSREKRLGVQIVSRDERHSIRFEPDCSSQSSACSS
jgi:flagellar assembly factor FliW